jgi:cytochrome c-type biogenesis protein CcmE
MVQSDLSRFVDQYFYTLKKYSFRKNKTKIRIKGMEWHRLIKKVEQQIKLNEGIGDSEKRVNSFYNGKTIDAKENLETKELYE